MTVHHARRKDAFKTHRFVTTSVISENCLPYTTKDQGLETPEACLKFWRDIISTQPSYEADKENLVVILLNSRLRPYAWHTVAIGHLTEVNAHPREILRPCIAGAAYAFILLHNHPSNDATPSRGDEIITRKIIEASQIMKINFMDHVVIGTAAPGRSPYYSFREAGIIP